MGKSGTAADPSPQGPGVQPDLPLSPGDPASKHGKEFLVEQALIAPGFNVHAKDSQGISEFYADDIALLKLAQKVKMSTHARCRSWGGRASYRGQGSAKSKGTLRMGLSGSRLFPQAHLPSLHCGGQHGSEETPRCYL